MADPHAISDLAQLPQACVTLSPPLPERIAALVSQGVLRRGAGYRGRFAPSPTGPLHRGNLRTALVSWLEARRRGGEWILRLDDLDTPRNRPGAEEAILADLRWLGLHWDGPLERQSQRRGLYATVLSGLRRSGHLYPCRCSRRLLADISAPHGEPPRYPGTCRGGPPVWGPVDGRLPSWRLKLPLAPLVWSERCGSVPMPTLQSVPGGATAGDPVLRRADGVIAYHLATAVDELMLGISEVVRGEDLRSSTPAQVAVMRALGQQPPSYRHLPLWLAADGRRLSKRQGSEGLEADRERGADAAQVIGAMAASLGLVPQGSRLSAEELAQESGRR